MGNTLLDSRINKKRKNMVAIKQVSEAYEAKGIKIRHILADEQFEHARKHIEHMGMILNITSRNEHVPENKDLSEW